MSKFVFPSLLSYTGSIKPGSAFFYAMVETTENNQVVRKRVPVEVTETTIKGTMSNHQELKKASNPEEATKSMGRANLQTIHQALLPGDTQEFIARFNLNLYPHVLEYNSCNDQTTGKRLAAFVQRYFELGGAEFLASRYVCNLMRGTWLWRNATLFESGKITVTARIDGQDKHFVNEDFSAISSFEPIAGVEELVQHFAKTLSGQNKSAMTGAPRCLNLRVEAVMDAYEGMEVFPSQEFTSGEVKNKEGRVLSRVLASVKGQGNIDHAVMHPQKIGNALRRIDDWYEPLDGFDHLPLAAEPLGVDSRAHVAHRATRKTDFYTLLEKSYAELYKALESAKSLDDLNDDHHYICSVLVRGGVFSGDKKASAKKDAA